MYEVQTTSSPPAPPQAETPPAADSRPGAPLDARRLWLAVLRRRSWIAGAFAAGLALCLPAGRILAPYLYVATATVVWEPPAELAAGAPDTERRLRTMVDSIELPSNLWKVRKRLKLRDPLPVIGDSIRVVDFDLASNVITVEGEADSPRAAARLANTAVDVFLEHRRSVERTRRGEVVRAIDADLSRARAELAGTRRRYDSFRTENGITDMSAESQQAIALAAQLRTQADLARADAEAEDARGRALQGEARRIAPTTVTERVVEATPVSADAQRLKSARLELAQARAQFTEDHPAVQDLLKRVESLEHDAPASPEAPIRSSDRVTTTNPEYEAVMSNVIGSAAQRAVAQRRQRSLAAMAEAAEKSLRKLSAIEGRASRLLAAQQVAENHVADLEASRAREADEAMAPSAGLEVLARAAPPELPVSQGKRIAVIIATPFVLALVVILGLLGAALGGLRGWTAREIAYWGRGPVVGSSIWPRVPDAIEALLRELEDVASTSLGVTLIVGATTADAELAGDLASTLEDMYAWPMTPMPATDGVDKESGERVAVSPGSYSMVDPEHRPRRTPPRSTRRPGVRTEASTMALAELRKSALAKGIEGPVAVYQPWDGPLTGPTLRRACRLADRVLVVVRSGNLSFSQLGRLSIRLGRQNGVGFLVVGLQPDLTSCADRCGAVAEFWQSTRA